MFRCHVCGFVQAYEDVTNEVFGSVQNERMGCEFGLDTFKYDIESKGLIEWTFSRPSQRVIR